MNPAELLTLANESLDAINAGRPLPSAGASWIRAGLMAMISGSDIRQGFQLPAMQGKPAESAIRQAARDQSIRKLIYLLDPDQQQPTKTSRLVVRLVSGESESSEDDVSALVDTLRQYPPVSARQIQRIARVSESEQENESINSLVCLWSSR